MRPPAPAKSGGARGRVASHSIRVVSKSALHEQKLPEMRKFIETAIPAILAIPAVGKSISKTVPPADTDHVSSTTMQLNQIVLGHVSAATKACQS